MITITERAQKALSNLISSKGGNKWLGLRLSVTGGIPGAWQSDFRPVRNGDDISKDLLIEYPSLNIYIDPTSKPKLEGVKIDVVPTFAGPNFKIDYPQPIWDDPIASKIQELITDRINPGLASHGGYIALLSVESGVANIVMGGGCQGCGLSNETLRLGVEVMIKDTIPEIKKVVDCTDHASGINPYYQPTESTKVRGKSPLLN